MVSKNTKEKKDGIHRPTPLGQRPWANALLRCLSVGVVDGAGVREGGALAADKADRVVLPPPRTTPTVSYDGANLTSLTYRAL